MKFTAVPAMSFKDRTTFRGLRAFSSVTVVQGVWNLPSSLTFLPSFRGHPLVTSASSNQTGNSPRWDTFCYVGLFTERKCVIWKRLQANSVTVHAMEGNLHLCHTWRFAKHQYHYSEHSPNTYQVPGSVLGSFTGVISHNPPNDTSSLVSLLSPCCKCHRSELFKVTWLV